MVYLQMTGSQRESDSLSPSLDFIVDVDTNALSACCLCMQTVLESISYHLNSTGKSLGSL